MKCKAAFIGGGHIAEILISRLRTILEANDICVYDPDAERGKYLNGKFGAAVANGVASAADGAETVFICVQPPVVRSLLPQLAAVDLSAGIIVTVAAGVRMQVYEERLAGAKVVRILPNPPSGIGMGAVPVAMTENLDAEDRAHINKLLTVLGKCYQVAEDKIDIFTSVTSPAPVFAFYEAMVGAAVYCGLDHDTALSMAKQTMAGCLAMLDEDGKNSHLLSTQACTPAGTSVESLRVMDKMRFRSAVIEAYCAAYEKSRNFGKA